MVKAFLVHLTLWKPDATILKKVQGSGKDRDEGVANPGPVTGDSR